MYILKLVLVPENNLKHVYARFSSKFKIELKVFNIFLVPMLKEVEDTFDFRMNRVYESLLVERHPYELEMFILVGIKCPRSQTHLVMGKTPVTYLYTGSNSLSLH